MADPGTNGVERPIPARRFVADFDADTPRHWCDGDPVLTHMLNAYTLLVPGNEGYYIRTLKLRMPRIHDPAMRVMVAQFLLQEGQHGAGHHRCWQMLEAQGYRISGFQQPVDGFLYKVLEPITPLPLRIAMVSCVEHVNAYLGHEFLSEGLLRSAEPELRALFEWHFAEEIEHKHVVFDVLQTLPLRYPLRLLGAVLVLPLFYLLMSVGAMVFLRQDRLLGRRDTWSRLRAHLFGRDHMFRRTCRHVFDYLRPGFHPWQLDDSALAQQVIDRYTAPDRPVLKPLPRSRAA
ncbi:metal-dependent hydrolase [Agrilutibacter solisilvae]|uniref:Metal-dependent hydrolase n=1 Tax=Agrilutibacter solisilvae TaxID=2763317 RepID=A0A974XXD2_9GAMM|nr:metal-dependent hydrolase [Lysobacter solisilvae]QSX77552.1 metal-dependent hydrolase [Lysobacter solisilvae]